MGIYVIRTYLRTFDRVIMKKLVEKLKSTANDLNILFKGPVCLPTRKECFNLLRSPHVNKNSRDQLSIFTHKKIMDFYVSNKESVLSLRNAFFFYNMDFNFKVL